MNVRNPRVRHVAFALYLGISVAVFWPPLKELFGLSLGDYRYSYIFSVPLAAVFVAYMRRRTLFAGTGGFPGRALSILLTACIGLFIGFVGPGFVSQDYRLSIQVCGIVLTWAAGFACCYGLAPFRTEAFALFFPVLLIPPPAAWIDSAAYSLQLASAELSYFLFKIVGIPVYKSGFTLSLPGVNIEVAEECSGIRSSISLTLMSTLASYALLESGWRRLCVVLATVPIVILKNALRIVGISILGMYVDSGFFYGEFHRRSGLPFSALAILMLLPLLLLLMKSERSSAGRRKPA
jgi:exosortase